MARRIRIPLEMKDGTLVNTIEELRQNFDIGKVLEHCSNGNLEKWLRMRGLEQMALQVAELSEGSENIVKRLFEIFEMPQEDIAYTQEELLELLGKGETSIRLYGGEFSIPLDMEGISYMGIGNVKVKIASDKPVAWHEKKISFKNIEFDEEYNRIEAADKKTMFFCDGTYYDSLVFYPGLYIIRQNGIVDFRSCNRVYNARRFNDVVHGIIELNPLSQAPRYGSMLYYAQTEDAEMNELADGVFMFPLGVADGCSYIIWSIDKGGMTLRATENGSGKNEEILVPYVPQSEVVFDERSGSIYFFAEETGGDADKTAADKDGGNFISPFLNETLDADKTAAEKNGGWLIKYTPAARKAEKLIFAKTVSDIKISDGKLIVCGKLETGCLLVYDTVADEKLYVKEGDFVPSADFCNGTLYYVEQSGKPKKAETVIKTVNLGNGNTDDVRMPMSFIPKRLEISEGYLYMGGYIDNVNVLTGCMPHAPWLKSYPVPKYRIRLDTWELQRLSVMDNSEKRLAYRYEVSDGKEELESYYESRSYGKKIGTPQTKTLLC